MRFVIAGAFEPAFRGRKLEVSELLIGNRRKLPRKQAASRAGSWPELRAREAAAFFATRLFFLYD